MLPSLHAPRNFQTSSKAYSLPPPSFLPGSPASSQRGLPPAPRPPGATAQAASARPDRWLAGRCCLLAWLSLPACRTRHARRRPVKPRQESWWLKRPHASSGSAGRTRASYQRQRLSVPVCVCACGLLQESWGTVPFLIFPRNLPLPDFPVLWACIINRTAIMTRSDTT